MLNVMKVERELGISFLSLPFSRNLHLSHYHHFTSSHFISFLSHDGRNFQLHLHRFCSSFYFLSCIIFMLKLPKSKSKQEFKMVCSSHEYFMKILGCNKGITTFLSLFFEDEISREHF